MNSPCAARVAAIAASIRGAPSSSRTCPSGGASRERGRPHGFEASHLKCPPGPAGRDVATLAAGVETHCARAATQKDARTRPPARQAVILSAAILYLPATKCRMPQPMSVPHFGDRRANLTASNAEVNVRSTRNRLPQLRFGSKLRVQRRNAPPPGGALAGVEQPAPRPADDRSKKRQLPLMVLITLDIGRASSIPPPISLSTISIYSCFGSVGVLPTICTTL